MVRKNSRIGISRQKKALKAPSSSESAKNSKTRQLARRIKIKSKSIKAKIHEARSKHLHLHKSFHRSYREDYIRETKAPSLLSHAMLTFKAIFKYWRTFLLFIILMMILYIVGVGLMSEDFYRQFQDSIDEAGAEVAGGEIGNFAKAGLLLLSTITSGGLDTGMDEAQSAFMIVLFLIMWLVVIFLLRHLLAGEKLKLRDGLYNALGPLLSTLVIFMVIFIQALPLMLAIIAYSAAVATNFLSTPFYALVFFIFAALMVTLSGYLLSSSIMALVAVTSPGMYPMTALFAASDLMAGRRIKFILRLIYLIFVLVLCFIIVMLPIILLDLWFKSVWSWLEGWPIVPFFLLMMTCFAFIYMTTYIYLYYRWLLDYKEEDDLRRG